MARYRLTLRSLCTAVALGSLFLGRNMSAQAQSAADGDAAPDPGVAKPSIDSTAPLMVSELRAACARVRAIPQGVGGMAGRVRAFCTNPWGITNITFVPSVWIIRCVLKDSTAARFRSKEDIVDSIKAAWAVQAAINKTAADKAAAEQALALAAIGRGRSDTRPKPLTPKQAAAKAEAERKAQIATDSAALALATPMAAELPDDPCGDKSRSQSFSANAGIALGSFQSTFLLAATDVLFARAQDAVRQDVTRLFAEKACTFDVTWKSIYITVDSLMRETCGSIRAFAAGDTANRYASPLPGLTAIRSSARTDLLALPATADGFLSLARVRLDSASESTSEPYAAIVTGLTALRIARGLAAGDAPGTVLRPTADSLAMWLPKDAAKQVPRIQALQWMTAAVGLLSTMDGAWPAGTEGHLSPSETSARVDHLLMTTVISCLDEKVQTWVAHLRERTRVCMTKDTLKNELDSLSKGIRPFLHQAVQAFAELPTMPEWRGYTANERRDAIVREATLLLPLIGLIVTEKTGNDSLKAKLTAAAPLAAHLYGQDYAAAVRDVIRLDSVFLGNSRLLTKDMARVIMVAADVALASDVDAMRTALESAIAPPNRYLAKRQLSPARTVYLNSYVGGVIGAEWATVNSKPTAPVWAAGLAMPIGVEFVLHRKFSLMLQLLDLGQVLNYRLVSPDTVSSDPTDLSFKTVFSPGILAAWRPAKPGAFFLKRPYALIGGASYAPSLRDVIIGSDAFRVAGAIRLFAGFAVDVPILP